uniref:Tartrate/fumarate subfamily Fe-S type hydro-lyase beta subunit n=1 Tax=uncultured organism TaxID=155900 RepID=M1Q1G8_9ZZZZ|nr:tartrate/fumarate subfamily Fe-S type hydro-lyase beta subunit [uncultured organism]
MKQDKAKNLTTTLDEKNISELRAGDIVNISGKMITARDKAYERILELLREGGELPVSLEGEVVYHCGPLVSRVGGGWRVVSAGPTTSGRMDDVQVEFVERTGVKGIVGKGGMGEGVSRRVGELGCVYLGFPGGAGALAARSVVSVEDVFWEDLGVAEALWVLNVESFGPLVVGVDLDGGNIYEGE